MRENPSAWNRAPIVLTPSNGYTRLSLDGSAWTDTLTLSSPGENQAASLYLQKPDGTIAQPITVYYNLDTEAPAGIRQATLPTGFSSFSTRSRSACFSGRQSQSRSPPRIRSAVSGNLPTLFRTAGRDRRRPPSASIHSSKAPLPSPPPTRRATNRHPSPSRLSLSTAKRRMSPPSPSEAIRRDSGRIRPSPSL